MLREHGRLIIICLTVIVVAIILAAQFRYKTYNKADLGTAVYDRWTGTMHLCDESGCFTQDELRQFAENRPVEPREPQPLYIETPLGVNLIFPGETSPSVVEDTVKRLDTCGAKAKTQDAFERCYRPSVSDQAAGRAYRVNGTPFLPGDVLIREARRAADKAAAEAADAARAAAL